MATLAKIPKDTRWRRFITFLRGLVLYNTVYWGRASDELRPPRPTRAERQQKRPQLDMSIVKPREKPRAKLVLDSEAAAEESSEAVTRAAFIAKVAAAKAAADAVSSATVAPDAVKKRRKVRKHRRAGLGAVGSSSGGMFKRIFKRAD